MSSNRYWIFTEQQLSDALDRWADTEAQAEERLHLKAIIRHFLESAAAHETGLIEVLKLHVP